MGKTLNEQEVGYVLITLGTGLLVFVLLTAFVLMVIYAVRATRTTEPTPRYAPRHHVAAGRPRTRVLHAPMPAAAPTLVTPKDPWLHAAETELRV